VLLVHDIEEAESKTGHMCFQKSKLVALGAGICM